MCKMEMESWRNDGLFADYPESVVNRFSRFLKNNPYVYVEFARYARQMKETGREFYSAAMIVGVLRWHRDLKSGAGEVFKINNDFIPMLARLLVYRQPQYATFFSMRVVRSRGILSDEENKRQLEQSVGVGLFDSANR